MHKQMDIRISELSGIMVRVLVISNVTALII